MFLYQIQIEPNENNPKSCVGCSFAIEEGECTGHYYCAVFGGELRWAGGYMDSYLVRREECKQAEQDAAK